jgi:hypothetical protein
MDPTHGRQDKADFQSAVAALLSICLHIVFGVWEGAKVALREVCRMALEAIYRLFSMLKWVPPAKCAVAGFAVSTLR